MSHTEYSAQFVQYSSVFLGLEEALTHEHPLLDQTIDIGLGTTFASFDKPIITVTHNSIYQWRGQDLNL